MSTREFTVRLTGKWATYLQGLVADRRFASADHAIEEALRLLDATEDKAQQLDMMLSEGEASGDAGSWDLDAFLREAREREERRQAA